MLSHIKPIGPVQQAAHQYCQVLKRDGGYILIHQRKASNGRQLPVIYFGERAVAKTPTGGACLRSIVLAQLCRWMGRDDNQVRRITSLAGVGLDNLCKEFNLLGIGALEFVTSDHLVTVIKYSP